MYPGTIIEYEDRSDIGVLPINEVRNRPLFLALFTSDKGVEDWNRVYGADFFKMYGDHISFAKHGQPLLQAAMTINAGGELYCKRLVAPDATLANLGIVATVTDTKVQGKNEDGELLYWKDQTDNDDQEGKTPVTADQIPNELDKNEDGTGKYPYMIDGKSVKYSVMSATNVKTIEEARTAINKQIKENDKKQKEEHPDVKAKTYLLYVISDNGRGLSKKRIKIVPNYRLSKSLEYVYYTFTVVENASEIESMSFSVNPSLIVKDTNISLQSMINANSTQVKCIQNESGLDAFLTNLATYLGITSDEMLKYDPLFGCTNRGVAFEGIVVDDDGIDLQYANGQPLINGSNGAFGDSPFSKQDVFSAAAKEALDGTYDSVIFNVDQNKIVACFDANYPVEVKRAIEALATFREDFMYIRDQGLGKTSIDSMYADWYDETKSMFCATYAQSYDVIDPYTKKQISVTICYSLAQLYVAHCDNGCIIPPAGMKNGFVIKDAIYGTLSFAPTVCPDPVGNQKEHLDELRINYASYIDNQLVVETLYTSQERYTQWSFINNVMGTQDVVRAIRTRCPTIRYSFIDGQDLEKYKADVEEAITPFQSNFKHLSLEYVNDVTYSVNKIFYAMLKVGFRDFVQTEWFKVIALSTSELESE